MNSILDYLEAAAREFPDKTAIGDRNHKYTFKQLQQASMRLAAVCARYATPGQAVGILADRNADVLAYFLAAVYCGCFYVPIDVDMPAAKINMIIENSGISLVLGSEDVRKLTEVINRDVHFVTLSDAGEDTCDNSSLLTPDSPLFMIYTSGSTGVPKGVLKSHKSVISYIEAYVDEFGFTENDVIGNQTPFFFDASAKDIYLMLKTGATMEVLPTEFFAMPPTLIRYMNEKNVTFISWVPSALSIIVQLNTFKAVLPETLKRVFFIGEVMPMKHLNKWIDALPELEYVNLYGSSEVAGISCFYRVNKHFENDESLPMGRPLSNCRVYLCDGDSVITENGKIGELYIVSDSVAMCYYGDEEKSAAAFIMKDFGNGPVRAFRTGDLAQYDAEGNLVFASRKDSQIKHMGHRIELGEIETIAGSLPEIARCACLYNAAKSRIVLFCTLSEGTEITDKEIKARLAGKLSSYMVPGRVVILEEMPFNANNKIDRPRLKELL